MAKTKDPTIAEIAVAKRIVRKAGQIEKATANKVARRRKRNKMAKASRRASR